MTSDEVLSWLVAGLGSAFNSASAAEKSWTVHRICRLSLDSLQPLLIAERYSESGKGDAAIRSHALGA
jgi:hypothetical protein